MTITLDLAPEVEAYLREKAAQEGQNAETVAQGLLAQVVAWEAQDRGGCGGNKARFGSGGGGPGAPGGGCLCRHTGETGGLSPMTHHVE